MHQNHLDPSVQLQNQSSDHTGPVSSEGCRSFFQSEPTGLGGFWTFSASLRLLLMERGSWVLLSSEDLDQSRRAGSDKQDVQTAARHSHTPRKSGKLTAQLGLGLPAAPVFASQPGEGPLQQRLSHGAPPPAPAGLGGAAVPAGDAEVSAPCPPARGAAQPQPWP